MSVSNLLFYYFYLAQEADATSASAEFSVTSANGVASVATNDGEATFNITDATGLVGILFTASGSAIYVVTNVGGSAVIHLAGSGEETLSVVNAGGSAIIHIVGSGEETFGVVDTDGSTTEKNEAVFDVTNTDGVAQTELVDQAPSPGPSPVEWFHAPYTKPPRVSFTHRFRASGGIIVSGAARVVTYTQKIIQKPVEKIKPKPIVRQPNHISVRGVGSITASGRATIHVHTRQIVKIRSKSTIEVSAKARITAHQHRVYATIASGVVNVAGSSSFDVHSAHALDYNAEISLGVSGSASVDVQTHRELDSVSSLHVNISGDALVHIVSRVPNVLTVVGRCKLTASGHAEAFGIEDRLTDEELLFLLEAA